MSNLKGAPFALLCTFFLLWSPPVAVSLPLPAGSLLLEDATWFDDLVVHKVRLTKFPAAYNPSLVEKRSAPGYWLFFRHDERLSALHKYVARIGRVSLDENFTPNGAPELLNLHAAHYCAEDPRVLWCKDQLYLFYSFGDARDKTDQRIIVAACLNPIDATPFFQTPLKFYAQQMEKNWTPFELADPATGDACLCFFRYLCPPEIYALPRPELSLWLPVVFSSPDQRPVDLFWEKSIGQLRGGTPAILVGDCYLGFFHSQIRDKQGRAQDADGMATYVMGAYTFAAKPPFKLLSVSSAPIFFPDIYESPVVRGPGRVLYPSGIVCNGPKRDRDVHVSCGENDSTMKILSFKLDTLLESLVPIP